MRNYILSKMPFLYKLRIMQLRLKRHIENIITNKKIALDKQSTRLAFTVKKHQSLLRRRLGSTDPILQENKIKNLGISIKKIDGVIIKPGETFSFWRVVGKTTAKKGYIEGLLLSQGEVKSGIGGGICQLANLLFWLTLHTPLEIKERHHHSFDPFPDEGRVLPFGSGASVFYNYIDLQFYNPTSSSFQIKVWLTDELIKGAIYCSDNWPYSYHLEERNHRFLRQEGRNYRENEIWRRTIDKKTGNEVAEELIIKNFSEVKYQIECDEQRLA